MNNYLAFQLYSIFLLLILKVNFLSGQSHYIATVIHDPKTFMKNPILISFSFQIIPLLKNSCSKDESSFNMYNNPAVDYAKLTLPFNNRFA